VHGLGFAGFFGELGLPKAQFLSGLIGFNVGVEIGQLSVVAAAFGVSWLARHKTQSLHERGYYRRNVVMPASLVIALTGTWWAAERTLAALA